MDSSNSSETSRPKLRSEWRRVLEQELHPTEGIPAVVRKRAALSNWDQLRSAPSGRVERELLYALQIAAGDYDHPLTLQCLQRANEVFAAGEEDPRWNTWWSATRNVEHGRFLSSGELAKAWLEDREPNRAKLETASAELMAGAVSERPGWPALAQSEYLHGIELLLICGNLEQAKEKLNAPYPFGLVARYFAWIRDLATRFTDPDSSDAQAFFDSYFDRIRNPLFRSGSEAGEDIYGLAQLRLRLALIRWIYIERKPTAGNWRHIIGQIGY